MYFVVVAPYEIFISLPSGLRETSRRPIIIAAYIVVVVVVVIVVTVVLVSNRFFNCCIGKLNMASRLAFVRLTSYLEEYSYFRS